MKNVPINSVNNKFTLGTRKKNYVRPALVKKDKLPCACIKKNELPLCVRKKTNYHSVHMKKDKLLWRRYRQTAIQFLFFQATNISQFWSWPVLLNLVLVFWCCSLYLYSSPPPPPPPPTPPPPPPPLQNYITFVFNHLGGDLHYHLSQHGVFKEDEVCEKTKFYKERKYGKRSNVLLFFNSYFRCSFMLARLSLAWSICTVNQYATEILR